MFGIIADFFASITTILFPVFASYKALRTADPAQLTPWLIYWVILSLILLVESWTVFIIGWLPFYSWIRLFALSYLVLPQTQGAKLLYANYIEPFIYSHERQIEVFIGDLHEKGSRAGLGYLKQLIDLIRQRVLNLPPTREEPPTPAASAGYAQSLLSRFAMPSARTSATTDFYSMLSGAVSAATSSSSSANTARSPSGTHTINLSTTSSGNSNPLFPSNITTNADKQSFLSSQREKLAILLKTLDREQRDLDLAYGENTQGLDKKLEADVERRMRDAGTLGGHDVGNFEMKKNRSDNSFQNIEREELEGDGPAPAARGGEGKKRQAAGGRTTSGGWNPTSWFGGGGGTAASGDGGSAGEIAKEVRDAVQGMSSSVDRSG